MKEHVKYNDISYKEKTIEVIDYVKDLISGKIETLKKIKPVGALVNTCLLQLFNEHGKPVMESLSHNIINEFQNRQAFSVFFYDLIKQSGISLSYKNPFTNLILTDYDGNESANELGLRGNVIGWANKNTAYSGADILKGTINLSESQTSDIKRTGLIQTVFDFPTHAANGQISSVWWMYGMDSDYRYHGYPYWQYYNSSTGGVDWACDGNYIYTTSYTTLARYNMDGSTVSSINVSGIDTDIRGIEFDGTYFWLYGNTTKKVYKCNTSFQVLAQFVASDVTGSFASITIFNNKIFIATTANLYRYSTIGTFETSKSAIDYGLVTITRIKANNTYCHITGYNAGTYFGFLDLNGDLVFKYNVTIDVNGWNQYCFVRNSDYNNSRLMIVRVGNYLQHMIIGGIGSHTKLATPVVKTAANTMKITYTFDIDLQTTLTW